MTAKQSDPQELKRQEDNFKRRMKERGESERKQLEQEAEERRQAYLTRTGRTEMKP